MNRQLVFVYGSLRRGTAGAMSVRFPEARFIADGHVSGRLFDLGAYPGLLLSADDLTVIGEIYEVDNDTLKKLDEFELTSDYVRKQVEVKHGSQRSQSWIYVPGVDAKYFSDRELIESCDWMEHVKSRQS